MAGKKKHKKAPAPTSPQIDLRVFLRKLRQQLDGPRGQRSGRASRARRSIWKARRVSDSSSASFLPARCAGNNGQLRLHPVPVLFFLFFFFFFLSLHSGTFWQQLAMSCLCPISSAATQSCVQVLPGPGPQAPVSSFSSSLEIPPGWRPQRAFTKGNSQAGWLVLVGLLALPSPVSLHAPRRLKAQWSSSPGPHQMAPSGIG